jgi:hypothetical protein
MINKSDMTVIKHIMICRHNVHKSGQNEVMRHGTNPDDITLIFTILRQEWTVLKRLRAMSLNISWWPHVWLTLTFRACIDIFTTWWMPILFKSKSDQSAMPCERKPFQIHVHTECVFRCRSHSMATVLGFIEIVLMLFVHHPFVFRTKMDSYNDSLNLVELSRSSGVILNLYFGETKVFSRFSCLHQIYRRQFGFISTGFRMTIFSNQQHLLWPTTLEDAHHFYHHN